MTGAPGTGRDARDSGRVGAGARIDHIRRSLAATTDAAARARLRVRLADMLAALGDTASGVAELKQAAAEAPPTAGLLLAVRFVATQLTADEAESLWASVRSGRQAKLAVPLIVSDSRPRKAAERKRARESSKKSPAPTSTTPPSTSTPGPAVPSPPRPALLVVSGHGREEPRQDPIDAAFAALAEKKPVRARRLAEEAARRAGTDGARLDRLRDLVKALDREGAKRESLRLARTLTETEGATLPVEALASVVDHATRAGQTDWAERWNSDLGRSPVRRMGVAFIRDGANATLPARFRAEQRAALIMGATGDLDTVIERLVAVIGGGAAVGAAALEFAERFLGTLGARGAARRAQLLRVAFDGERSVRRRERLAIRWADALVIVGDTAGAIAVLDRAIAELPIDNTVTLRPARANLLRAMGRDVQLTRALAADAEALTGPARLALLATQADLLDRLGESDRALDVRLSGLMDAPGDLGLLALARRRLEAVGRLDRSLDLAMTAAGSVERAARTALLRDVATLSEVAAGDRERAVTAWLEVISLDPADTTACDAAERLLREMGDRKRLGELLAWSAARQPDPEARAGLLWPLAEFRRVEQQSPMGALALYREIILTSRSTNDRLTFPENDWQRRDNLLAVHTARALAAPTTAARAQAIAARASALIDAGRLADADRDLDLALDLDPGAAGVMDALEKFHEQRGDWRVLRERLSTRLEGATGIGSAHLWFGVGRANERLGEVAAARAAYERAMAATDGFCLAVTALRQLAFARGDWPEVARLLEKEIELVTAPSVRVGLLVELGGLLADKLSRASRAVEILDLALASEPTHAGALDALFGAALGSGAWDKAAQTLEAMLAAGIHVPDAAQRYHRIGRAAEHAGQIDRALGLYSRSYARNPGFRPTLERLSEICFERQQWDNAWKATEHLVERHGADLDPGERATLALRSALADLHVAQRFAAQNGIGVHLGGPPSQTALRDVAESWASMRFEPRLLGSLEGDRRARVLSRLGEVLALTEAAPAGGGAYAARLTARETLGALAVVDRRWADAISLLDGLGADEGVEPRRRCLFLVAAGDVLVHQQGDVAGAALRYQRARALNPNEPRLARAGIIQVATEQGNR